MKHNDPGEEIIYVLEGSLESHAAELATYFVEKGKPFLVIVE